MLVIAAGPEHTLMCTVWLIWGDPHTTTTTPFFPRTEPRIVPLTEKAKPKPTVYPSPSQAFLPPTFHSI